MKDRWYKAALEFVNEQRAYLNLAPLRNLYKGRKKSSDLCPLSTSVRGPHKDWAVNTVAYMRNTFGTTHFPGTMLIVSNDIKRVILPVDVSHFLVRFDNGFYPELEEENAKKNS